MRRCCLYRITNLSSGHDYVGITVDTRRRWQAHVDETRRGSTTPLHRALRKYGRDAFSFRVIAVCSSPEGAKVLEMLAIHLGLGYYNATKGGDGCFGYSHGPEALERMRSRKLGTKLSQSHKDKIGAAQKGRVFTAEHLEKIRAKTTGQKRTEEAKAKMRASQKARRAR